MNDINYNYTDTHIVCYKMCAIRCVMGLWDCCVLSYHVSVRIRSEMTAWDHLRFPAYLGGCGPKPVGMKTHKLLFNDRGRVGGNGRG